MIQQRIVWCQDFSPFDFGGGAQQTDVVYIRAGLKLGYRIDVLTPQNAGNLLLDKSDVVILSNIRSFPEEKILGLSEFGCKTITFNHDYLGCLWRLYYPVSQKCLTDCPAYEYARKVFARSSLNIFLSPLHEQAHRLRFGDDLDPVYLTPSGIDTSAFFPIDKKKKRTPGSICSVDTLLPFKGRKNIIKFAKDHPNIKIDIAGAKTEEGHSGMGDLTRDLPPNIKVVGPIEFSRMNEWYNEHEIYLELPDTPQPFNRTNAEAALAGCKVQGNELVGALSWDWFKTRASIKKALDEAPAKFWARIEKAINDVGPEKIESLVIRGRNSK